MKSKTEWLYAYLITGDSNPRHFTKHKTHFGAEKHYGDLQRGYKGSYHSDSYLNILTKEELIRIAEESNLSIDWKAQTFTEQRKK